MRIKEQLEEIAKITKETYEGCKVDAVWVELVVDYNGEVYPRTLRLQLQKPDKP